MSRTKCSQGEILQKRWRTCQLFGNSKLVDSLESVWKIPLHIYLVEQGWRSGESNRFPQMWPGFKSWRLRHSWLFCSERFFAAYSSVPLSLKTIISKFLFDQEPGRRRTTKWMCFLYKSLLSFIPTITSKMTMYQELISHYKSNDFLLGATQS